MKHRKSSTMDKRNEDIKFCRLMKNNRIIERQELEMGQKYHIMVFEMFFTLFAMRMQCAFKCGFVSIE